MRVAEVLAHNSRAQFTRPREDQKNGAARPLALPPAFRPHFLFQNDFSSRSCRRWNVNEESSLILSHPLPSRGRGCCLSGWGDLLPGKGGTSPHAEAECAAPWGLHMACSLQEIIV